MLYADKNLEPIRDGIPYTAPGGTQYPRNFPKAEIPSLTVVAETPQPDDPLLNVTGFVIDENHNQVWQTEAKPAEQIAAEAMRDWTSQMAATDDAMPRHMEDLIDTLDGLLPVLDNMPLWLLEAYNKKKSIRAEKPPGG